MRQLLARLLSRGRPWGRRVLAGVAALLVLSLASLTLPTVTALWSERLSIGGTVGMDPPGPTPSPTPIPATVDLKPEALQLKSTGEPVTAYIELPAPWRVQDIAVSSIRLSFGGGAVAAQLSPTAIGDYDNDGVPDRMVKFPRAQVVAMLRGQGGNTVTLAVTGSVAGRSFRGTDTMRVIGCGSGPAADCDPGAPATPTRTASPGPTASLTRTATPGPSSTATPRPTQTATPTPTRTRTPTPTPTPGKGGRLG